MIITGVELEVRISANITQLDADVKPNLPGAYAPDDDEATPAYWRGMVWVNSPSVASALRVLNTQYDYEDPTQALAAAGALAKDVGETILMAMRKAVDGYKQHADTVDAGERG